MSRLAMPPGAQMMASQQQMVEAAFFNHVLQLSAQLASADYALGVKDAMERRGEFNKSEPLEIGCNASTVAKASVAYAKETFAALGIPISVKS